MMRLWRILIIIAIVDGGNPLWGHYDFSGQIASSQAGAAAERKRGWGGEMAVGKRSGWLQGGFHWEGYSKDFEINDLGFLWRNNYYETRFQLQFRKDRPWNFFRRNSLNINQWRRRNFDDVVLANGIGLSTWHQFRNYWDISGAINHNFRTQDDLDTGVDRSSYGPLEQLLILVSEAMIVEP